MTSIQTSIKRVQRRVFVSRFLNALGWAVMAGLVLSALVMIADKLMPLTQVPLWGYGVIAGVGLVVASVMAFGKLPDEADAAVLLDDKLKLQDKLGTAMYTATLEEQNELTEQIAREADEAAQKARVMVGQAAPITPGKVWNWTPIAAALVLGVYFLMPANAGDPLGQVAAAEAEAKEEQLAEQGAEVIINTVQQDLTAEDEEEDNRIAAGLPDNLQDQLVSLSDQIRKNPTAAEELLKDAESLVSDAEDRLGEQVDVVEAAFNPLQNDSSGLDAGQPGPADEFTKAMNAADFDKAKDALEELRDQIDKGEFDEQTQQQLQQQLNNLANQLQQQAQQAQQRQQQAQQQAQQNLQQQLQNSGMSQQQAQQLSQQIAQQMQQQQQQQQGQQGSQGQQQQQQGQQGNQGQQQQQQAQQQAQQQIQQALQQQGMSQQQAQQQAQQMAQQMQQQMQQAQGQCQSGQMQQQLGQGLQQMAGQCNKPGGQQGQQGQQGQGQQGQGGQCGQSAQQAINQMAQMQQQLQRMQQQQAGMQQAMNQLNQMQQQGQGQQGQGGGVGGKPGSWGTSPGGNPYGAETPGYQRNSYAAKDIQQGEGRVIASWTEYGEVAPGEANVQFNASRTEAVKSAERAVTEDRVPRRYHESIKSYFQQLPEDPNAGRAPSAPR